MWRTIRNQQRYRILVGALTIILVGGFMLATVSPALAIRVQRTWQYHNCSNGDCTAANAACESSVAFWNQRGYQGWCLDARLVLPPEADALHQRIAERYDWCVLTDTDRTDCWWNSNTCRC